MWRTPLRDCPFMTDSKACHPRVLRESEGRRISALRSWQTLRRLEAWGSLPQGLRVTPGAAPFAALSSGAEQTARVAGSRAGSTLADSPLGAAPPPGRWFCYLEQQLSVISTQSLYALRLTLYDEHRDHENTKIGNWAMHFAPLATRYCGLQIRSFPANALLRGGGNGCRLLHQTVEKLPVRARSSAIGTESEFVKIVIQIRGAYSTLVGP